MAWKARIETVLLDANGAVLKVEESQTLNGAGNTKVTSNPLSQVGKDKAVQARITVLSGVILVNWGPEGHVPAEADAMRISESSEPMMVSTIAGTKFYIIESADAERGGRFKVSASFSRPADTTAYAAGDRIANATSGAVVLEVPGVFREPGELVTIDRLVLRKSGNSLTNAQFRAYLFNTLPVSSAQDNAAFSSSGTLTVNDVAGMYGPFAVTMDNAGTAGARGSGIPAAGSSITIQGGSVSGHETSLWVLLDAAAAYTPVSGETFTLEIDCTRT